MRPRDEDGPDVAALALACHGRARLAGDGDQVVPAVGGVHRLAARWTGDTWVLDPAGTLVVRFDEFGREVRAVYGDSNGFDVDADPVGWVVAAPPWMFDTTEVQEILRGRRRRRRSTPERKPQ